MSTYQSLIEANTVALEEGAELLKILGDGKYTQGYKPAFHSTIGGHFRHVLEHYRCLFSQLNEGTLSYDKRERDQRLECDLAYAMTTIRELKLCIANIPNDAFAIRLHLLDEQISQPVATTLERELLFLQSHTVHHYAIIGAMARALGDQPQTSFGVAIATRTNEMKTQNSLNIGGASTCAQ